MSLFDLPMLQVCCPFSWSTEDVSACIAGTCFRCLYTFFSVLIILSWSRYPLFLTALRLE